MRWMHVFTAAAAVTAGALAVCAPTGGRPRTYHVGDEVANFQLPNDTGKAVRSSAFRGKLVVLTFYASWCPGCNEEAPRLEKEVWSRYRARGVRVVGVAIQEGKDPLAKLREFRKRHGVTYPLLSDEKRTVFDRFGYDGIPTTALIDRNGAYSGSADTVEGIVRWVDRQLAPKPKRKRAPGAR